MSTQKVFPLVSIGLPVYNGERFLPLAIESLLSQDYPNFELIISDNASIDNTEAISRQYSLKDKRVIYSRSEKNYDAAYNFNRAFSLAKGKYFMWAADDDLRAPSFISRCVSVLESNPDTILCCTDTQFITESGNKIANYVLCCENMQADDLNIVSRIVKQVERRDLGALAIYGLIRSEVLKKTRLLTNMYGGDNVLVFELLLAGKVQRIPEKLLYFRIPDKPKLLDDYSRTYGNTYVVPKYPETDILREFYKLINEINESDVIKANACECLLNSLCNNDARRDMILDEHYDIIGPFFTKSMIKEFMWLVLSSAKIETINRIKLGRIKDNWVKFTKNLIGKRPIFFWGAGSSGCKAYSFFYKNNIAEQVVGFIDNNPEKQGSTVMDLPVYLPSILVKNDMSNRPFIIISSMYATEIEKQLEQMGLKRGNDFLKRFSLVE